MLRLSAGWVMNKACADRLKDPLSAKAMKCRNCTKVMPKYTHKSMQRMHHKSKNNALDFKLSPSYDAPT